jgi:hypothetical protein
VKAKTFEQIFEAMVICSRETLLEKSKQYATEDRLANFKRAAALQKCSSVKALLGMVAKHIVALYKFADTDTVATSQSQWNEKIGDTINYMILLNAIVIEEKEEADARCTQ